MKKINYILILLILQCCEVSYAQFQKSMPIGFDSVTTAPSAVSKYGILYRLLNGSALMWKTASATNTVAISASTPLSLNATTGNLTLGTNLNKVDSIYRTLGKDSIQFTIDGRYHAIKDSVGGGSSFSDSGNFAKLSIANLFLADQNYTQNNSTDLTLTSYHGTNFPQIKFQRGKGSQASPLAVGTGTELGYLQFSGYGATGFISGGSLISATGTQTWTDANAGSNLNFYTTPNNSTTRTLALTIGQDQELTLANAIDTAYTDAKITRITAGSGISVNTNVGNVTVTATGTGGTISRVYESDGSPTQSDVDSLAFNSTNLTTTNSGTSVATVNTIQNINTTASPTFSDLYLTDTLRISGGGETVNLNIDGNAILFSDRPIQSSGELILKNGTYSFSISGTPTAGRALTLYDAAGTIALNHAQYGGTAQTTWTTGDLLYASGTNTLAKLGVGAGGTVLIGGATPSYSATPSITTSVTVPTIYGSTASGGDLTFYSTSHATKGNLFFGTSTYDEVNNRLGIGTTSPQDIIHTSTNSTLQRPRFQVSNSTAGYPRTLMDFYRSRGTAASPTTISSGDYLGSFRGVGYNDAWVEAAGFDFVADGTVTTTAMPGRIEFYTTAAGAETMTEAMRIDAAQNIGIGMTATTRLSVMSADNTTNTTHKINATSANITASDIFVNFTNSSNVSVGDISGTAVSGVIAYNTFTGGHYAQLSNEAETFEIGMLVSATGQLMDNAKQLPLITKTIGRADKRVYGVFAGRIADGVSAGFLDSLETQLDTFFIDSIKNKKGTKRKEHFEKRAKGTSAGYAKGNARKDMYQVFAVGTGVCLVTETGGDISVGDLIWSSPIAGLGEKQADDLVRSSTVAKATESVKWANVKAVNGIKKRLIAVTYR